MPAATSHQYAFEVEGNMHETEDSHPWYETSADPENTIPTSTPQSTDLYPCTICINVPQEEVSRLQDLYSPLLQWIDPVFQLVRVQKGSKKSLGMSSHDKGRQVQLNGFPHPGYPECQEPLTGLVTQALSVILFLRDDGQSQLTASGAAKYLQSQDWKLHHKIELTSRLDLRVVARQVFYASSPDHDLPLWSVCSVHCGSEQLRFNVFVSDFEGMKEFYRTLLNKEVSAFKPGFCLFQIYVQPGLEIQLSLKFSPCLLPEPTKKAVLCFRVKDLTHLQKVLPYKVIKHENCTWRTRDIDGNTVLLSRDTSHAGYPTPQAV